MTNPRLTEINADVDLQSRQLAARLRGVASPDALVSDLHDIGVVTGDAVVDTVTGLSGVVLGYGVQQVLTGE